MIKSAAQCLLFAIVHETVCKDAVKKTLLFPLYVQQSFVFDPCFFWIFEFRYAVLMYVDDSTSQMPKKAWLLINKLQLIKFTIVTVGVKSRWCLGGA